MRQLRLALFVEGGQDPPEKRRMLPLEGAWQQLLQACLGNPKRSWELVVPISKKHLLAMDPSLPKMSGASEGLDALMARKLRERPFDAVVVAWDLWPRWHKADDACRRKETLDLYRLLSLSPHLPLWQQNASERLQALEQRRPSYTLCQNDVIAICMEPMFEGLLTFKEDHVRTALLENQPRPQGWPSRGWGTSSRPDSELLKPAIGSLNKRQHPAHRTIGRSYEQTKNHWNEWILRKMLEDATARPELLEQTIPMRMRKKLVS